MEFKPHIVYVRTDDLNRITAVNSNAFLSDTDGWMEIDRGYGDKYAHAYGNYFDKHIMDERGIKRYQAYPFVEAPAGEIIARFFKDDVEYLIFERTQEEMDEEYYSKLTSTPTRLDIIEAQITYTAMVTDTLLEV